MNVYFKIRHYLAPYFLTKPSYKFNPESEGFNLNYWVTGYAQNVVKGKWAVEDGIPLGLYTKDLDYGMEKRVHIAGLCEYCFANIELDLEMKNDVVLDFLSEYIVHEKNESKGFSYSFWRTFTDPENDFYYVHGMGQGQMLSLFSRYYQKTNKEEFKDLLVNISNSYMVDFNHINGFVNLEGGTFFEEYPKRQDTDPKVFNGWMYAIIGLHDYLKVATPESDQKLEKKKDLYHQSVETLLKNLKNYNLCYWTTYCQPKSILNICSIHYQIQHISLLQTLFQLTGEKAFKKYSETLLFQFYNPLFRILSLISKLLISNIFKYGRLYKSR